MQEEFELGSEGVDVVTKFQGILVSRAIHLNGCDRYFIQPQVGKDGKYPDGIWCDVTTIKILKKPIVMPSAEKKSKTSTQAKPGGFSSRVK